MHEDNQCNRVWNLIWNGNLSLKVLYTKCYTVTQAQTPSESETFICTSLNLDRQCLLLPQLPLNGLITFVQLLYSSLVSWSILVFLFDLLLRIDVNWTSWYSSKNGSSNSIRYKSQQYSLFFKIDCGDCDGILNPNLMAKDAMRCFWPIKFTKNILPHDMNVLGDRLLHNWMDYHGLSVINVLDIWRDIVLLQGSVLNSNITE